MPESSETLQSVERDCVAVALKARALVIQHAGVERVILKTTFARSRAETWQRHVYASMPVTSFGVICRVIYNRDANRVLVEGTQSRPSAWCCRFPSPFGHVINSDAGTKTARSGPDDILAIIERS
eukprot:scaffold5206_cov78-Skeletonema_dohrnii-CCMP3373.AAC.1